MRKLAGISIISFGALALIGASGASPVEVGGGGGEPSKPEAWIVIEKNLPDDFDAELPSAWSFRVDSLTCGDAIITSDGVESSAVVVVEAQGGETTVPITLGIHAPSAVGVTVVPSCDFRILELEVEGWQSANPPGGFAEVTVEFNETVRVPFFNRPVPTPEVTTTTAPETTTTTETTSTTIDDTTTTVPEATTTMAPTTAPPTTAGTVAPELPATGSSNALAGLLAGLLVLGGIGAIIASRRTT